MKYLVKIDYKRFIFNDRIEALDFADMAIEHSDASTDVSIEILREADHE